MVGICKTFWLKIIQRKWKKIYAERKRVQFERMKTSELTYRERNAGGGGNRPGNTKNNDKMK